MKKLFLLLIITAMSFKINCQILNVVNVQTGISVSKQNFLYTNSLAGFSEFAGVEYLDVKVYNDIVMNLNSNIGIIRKGGQFKSPESKMMFSTLGFTEEKLRLNYFTINTNK